MSIKPVVTINLEKLAKFVNALLPLLTVFFFLLGYLYSFYFHFLTVGLFLLTVINIYYLHIQKEHTLLANFGLIAQGRYMMESIGPELRQYLYSSDTEERPFNRVSRSEVYRKAKGIDSSSAFGSQYEFDGSDFQLLHSMYPQDKQRIAPFELILGEERGIKNTFTLTKPVMISAMSYGALGENAVRSLARGAKKAGIPMNTGEGGYPKYHLMENCDLIFQIGTAKFGVRNDDGTLNDSKLRELTEKPQVKMVEIKLSQGAKPGKGGLLPKEKITKEISELRGVPMGSDVISPSFHAECTTPDNTIKFIKRVQDVSQLPVGIKLCLGQKHEFENLVDIMAKYDVYPDYISIDGAEGGTGAAPKSFMNDLGTPLFQALAFVQKTLVEKRVRQKLKLFCAGKLISPGQQFMAMSLGADAVYTARGFMLALGCIQALQCNNNTCPVGITTHEKHLQHGVNIEEKSTRVYNYVKSMNKDYYELLASIGGQNFSDLSRRNLLFPIK